jgi:hypothetical protein
MDFLIFICFGLGWDGVLLHRFSSDGKDGEEVYLLEHMIPNQSVSNTASDKQSKGTKRVS